MNRKISNIISDFYVGSLHSEGFHVFDNLAVFAEKPLFTMITTTLFSFFLCFGFLMSFFINVLLLLLVFRTFARSIAVSQIPINFVFFHSHISISVSQIPVRFVLLHFYISISVSQISLCNPILSIGVNFGLEIFFLIEFMCRSITHLFHTFM